MDWIEVHTDRPVVVAANDPSPRYPRIVPEQMRRTQLMAAAEDLFLDRGFVATTMSDIARAAGMSKKTIYQVFTSKTDLFLALLHARLTTPPPLSGLESLEPEAALALLLQQMAQQVLSPDSLALQRLILGSLTMLPEIRGVFEEHCRRVQTVLETWLRSHAARGDFHIPDVTETASMLLAYAIGDFHWRLLAGIGAPPTEAALAARIKAAIAIFTRECAIATPIAAAG